jgi:hypothetical protein
MKAPVKPKGAVWPAACGLLVVASVLAFPALERTLFKDLPPNDTVREVVETVLGAKFTPVKGLFTSEEWSGGGYGAAWDRARGYFPGRTYFVRPGTYFMTHGFDGDGRRFMEIHDSPYLALCVANRRTFMPGSSGGDYDRMRAAENGREAAAFREKLGRLEEGFRDEKSHRDLRRSLGEPLYARLLQALREEDHHMLAGGLIHEGMHASLDDVRAARLQAEFKAGTRPVQWDELGAFMAETGYHARFVGWAAADIGSSWGRIEALLKDLEKFRRMSRLPAAGSRTRFDRIGAQARAQAALSRLRARETWQSARRMQELVAGLRKDYFRGDAPKDLASMLERLESGSASYVAAAGEAIQSNELALRALEDLLEAWGAWAGGRRPFPPPVTDSQAVLTLAGDIRWPAADTRTPSTLMRMASEELLRD